ncbi:MAG TPA: PLP-dependent aminotransferase family protein [Marmoricola sp.]|nr:PLP-dependent aminotransferase family protein [Marmoricola sp.]
MERRVSSARLAALLGPAAEQAPAYLSIADGVRLLVTDRRIPPGTRLPSERELTVALGVSRTTVTRAYAHLRDQGLLVSRQGSGSVVQLPPTTAVSDMLLDPGPGGAGTINLTCAAPMAPHGVGAAYEVALEELAGQLPEYGYFPSGVPALREAIARRYDERGLPTTPDQVLVTSGALSALAIVARAFVGPGDRVLMESPTYPNAIATLRGSGARVVGADIDQTGWATSSLVDTVKQVRPRSAYLMPDFHNPTGLLMADLERERLAAALRRARTLVVVDETMVETAMDDAPTPLPFAAHAPDTVTLGSASKAYWGGLRIGWIRVPQRRMAEVIAARLSLDLGAPVLEQLALVQLMARREELFPVRREQLAASRAALVSALATELPSWRFRMPAGGLSLWCELPGPVSSALSNAARDHGVQLAPGPLFAPEGGLERYLRLPFTQAPETMTEAIGRIAAAWAGLPRRRTSRTARPATALVT